MPMLQFYQQNLGSGATYRPLDGWQYEYLPFPALVEIAIIASAASSANVTVTSGSDTLAENQPIGGGGTDGVYPDADKPIMEDIAAAGDRLKILVTETAAAGTVDIMGWIRITRLQ